MKYNGDCAAGEAQKDTHPINKKKLYLMCLSRNLLSVNNIERWEFTIPHMLDNLVRLKNSVLFWEDDLLTCRN